MQIPKTKKQMIIPVYNDNCTVSSNQSEIFRDDDWEEEAGENDFFLCKHAAFFLWLTCSSAVDDQ